MDKLHRDIDGDTDAGIPAVVEVIAAVDVIHINVVIVIPVIAPVFRPRVDFAKPITLVLEAWESANHQKGQT